MITFILSIGVLILGYLFYSRFVERIEGIDPARQTPAYKLSDGVDYVPALVAAFLIQFSEIAGLGPIFGAMAGAMWGPVAFLWLVLVRSCRSRARLFFRDAVNQAQWIEHY
jgi:carbon starvation protein CstA